MGLRTASFLFLGALAVAHGGGGLRGRTFAQQQLLTDMHPELVSKFLNEVETAWTSEAVAAKTGKMNEAAALRKMKESCVKVANSVVAGSDGDKDKVGEYMDTVCSQDQKGSKEAERCSKFGSALMGFMNADAESNRDDLDTAKFCDTFYKQAVEEEAVTEVKRLTEEAKVKAAKDAEAKKRADEEAARRAIQEKKQAFEKSKKEAKDAGLKSLVAVREAEAAEEAAVKLTARTEKKLKVQDENMREAEMSADKLRTRARKEMEAAEKKEVEEQKKAAVREVEEREKARKAAEAAKLEAAKEEAKKKAKEAEEAKKELEKKKKAEREAKAKPKAAAASKPEEKKNAAEAKKKAAVPTKK